MPSSQSRTPGPAAVPRLVAFLRAINVGGHTVKMDALRKLFTRLGLTDVETFIASGNVIFGSRSRAVPALQRRIEGHLRDALGYEVHTFIRTGAEVAAIARYRPFPAPQMRTAHVVCVGFVAEPLGTAATKAFMGLRTANDDFHVHGTEVYWLCRTRQSKSEFSNAAFEKATKARATFRGMNTIVKLTARHGFGAEA